MDTLYDFIVCGQKAATGFYFRVCWSWNRLSLKTSPAPSVMRDTEDWRRELARAVEQTGVVLDTWDIDKTDHGLGWDSVVGRYRGLASERVLSRSLVYQGWMDQAEMTGCGGGLLPGEVEIDL